MKVESELVAVLAGLARRGLPAAEVFRKDGRSRRFVRDGPHQSAQTLREEGWAVRAGDERRSFFLATTDPPAADGQWPEPDGYPLRLPPPLRIPGWREPSDLDAPVVAEREGEALLIAVAEALGRELPGARLDLAILEDGSSRSRVASSRGVRATWRHRVASIHLEASWRGIAATLDRAEREARRLLPATLARALADRLLVRAEGNAPEPAHDPVVLAPLVAAQVLAALTDLWCGEEAARHAGELADGKGRLAAPALTLVDDGRWPQGVLAAPVDGEGLPTRSVTLIEQGRWRQALRPWWASGEDEPAGCLRRPGWRDLPAIGPSHLALRPDPRISPADLVASLDRGSYLLDVDGPGRFDLAADRFALPVCGFAVRGGRAASPLAGAWLAGRVSDLLHGVSAVGRDLAWLPGRGMIGSPTLLVTGLELRPEP